MLSLDLWIPLTQPARSAAWAESNDMRRALPSCLHKYDTSVYSALQTAIALGCTTVVLHACEYCLHNSSSFVLSVCVVYGGCYTTTSTYSMSSDVNVRVPGRARHNLVLVP